MTTNQLSRKTENLSRLCILTALVTVCLLAATTALSAQTVADLYSFTANGASQYPDYVTPAQGRNGELYGTTISLLYGSVFGVQTSGVETGLFSFDNADGYNPYTGLTLGTDGNFYGTTAEGGSASLGVLFKIAPSGAFTVLHEFLGETDGGFPRAAPMEASDGNLYGTTLTGSNDMGATVYKYQPSSGAFTTIYAFSEATYYYIDSPLIQAANGNLYGTGYYGSNNCGAIFELATSGVLVKQYNFSCTGGINPFGNLLQASDGNFYGTTYAGSGNVGGIVFKMTPQGRFTTLHTFVVKGVEGWEPGGGLVEGTDGNLYGSTRQGGNRGDIGTLYQITTGGVFTELYSFPKTVGQYPEGALLQHTNGLFYGTAYEGGAHGYGAVFTLDMGLGPFVTFVRPSGQSGSQAQILGQGFTGASSVTFNGIPAKSFTVVADTYMTAVVPSGATTGSVVVTAPGGALSSNVNFVVTP